MLNIFVGGLIIGGAGAMLNEGLFSATIIFFSTIFAGLITFNYFEPVSALLDRAGFLSGYTDFIAIVGLFTISVTALRIVSEQVAPTMIEFPELMHKGGGAFFGAITGWILSGMLLCAIQTLPLSKDFLGYNVRDLQRGNAFDCDRYWLAYMNRASSRVFEQNPPMPFDREGDFTLRYSQYRRTDGSGQVSVAKEPTRTGPVRRPGGGGRRAS